MLPVRLGRRLFPMGHRGRGLLMPARKTISTDPEDWKLYDKIARATTKQVGVKVYVNGMVKLMAQEYIRNHPELQIKV